MARVLLEQGEQVSRVAQIGRRSTARSSADHFVIERPATARPARVALDELASGHASLEGAASLAAATDLVASAKARWVPAHHDVR